MFIPNATLEVYKNSDNSITVHGIYYGTKASRFIAVRNRFDELVKHMLQHHDLTCYTGRLIHEYHNLWTYTVHLHNLSELNSINDIVVWYQGMAQKYFYTPEQYESKLNPFINAGIHGKVIDF